MSNIKITIPKMTGYYKLYVYCSKNPRDIDTIAKIRTIKPYFVIDESLARTYTEDGTECYIVYGYPFIEQDGVTFYGPVLSAVPVTEYETSVSVVKVNDYTYVNELVFNELPIKHSGVMFYYSVIGIDETENMVTHLSKVSGVMYESGYKETGTKHIYECSDYKGSMSDEWKFVAAVPYSQEIRIGDITDTAALSRFGVPVVETVPVFKPGSVNAVTRNVSHGNRAVIEIPNPWQKNNSVYNARKLKSYKIQNVDGGCYSAFSEPTYQSMLPVPIEKMLMVRKDAPEDPDAPIPSSCADTEGYSTWHVIRKDGIFYNPLEHRKFGINKYNIPLSEKTAVFSEGSVQDYVKIQVPSLPAHVYSYTIYLYDIYGFVSAPCHFAVRT